MTNTEAVLKEIRRALESEPRIDFVHQTMNIVFANGELLLSGEVGDISVKRLAVRRASEVPEVVSVQDEMRVRSDKILPDSEIRDLLHSSLAAEPALGGCTLHDRVRGGFRTTRIPEVAVGRIDVSTTQGTVTLEGEVPSIAQKRLAGVVAWWTPGTVNVVNNLSVQPPEEDSDEALAESLRLVLEKDQRVHMAGIRVGARGGAVTLEGTVPDAEERAIVERDAWYVFGVEDVVNRLAIHGAAIGR